MADYPNSIESIAFQAGHFYDQASVDLQTFFPLALGIGACRPTGVYSGWRNKVWDPGGPAWVTWETVNGPDTVGVDYPDPYGTGFGGVSSYRVSGIDYFPSNLQVMYPEDLDYG